MKSEVAYAVCTPDAWDGVSSIRLFSKRTVCCWRSCQCISVVLKVLLMKFTIVPKRMFVVPCSVIKYIAILTQLSESHVMCFEVQSTNTVWQGFHLQRRVSTRFRASLFSNHGEYSWHSVSRNRSPRHIRC